MREILFRGKRIDNGEWIFGSLVSLDDKGKAILKSKSVVYMSKSDNTLSSSDCYEVVPESVGQYTGLMDENGTKIFEGDILKDRLDGDISEVIYTRYAFKVKNVKRKYILTLAGYHNCEVIGNIYDNPELLEVNNE